MIVGKRPMVQPLEASDAEEAGHVLARAFRDNPGVVAVLRGDPPEQRLKLVTPSMVGFVKGVQRYGFAEGIKQDGKVVAVSLSFGPGQYPQPLGFELMTAWGPLRSGPSRALRFLRIDTAMRRRHPKYPHWYLWFLGVEPDLQGKGLGSRLLASLSARAEKDGVPSYLETDKPTSVKLYQKHGYAVVDEQDDMAGFGFKLWFMRRPGPG